MKKIAFLGFPVDKLNIFKDFVNESDYTIDNYQIIDELFNQVFNNDIKYYAIFINSLNSTQLSTWTPQIKEHLKTISLNLVIYDNEFDIKPYEVDNYVNIDVLNKENFFTLLRSSVKLTETLDMGLKISNDYYHFEFFKKIIHIEIKRAKRYQIHLSLMYLTFDNVEIMKKEKSAKEFDLLFKNFTDKITTSIRDIDIPITFGDEAILILMPHTDKSGANIVAERIYNKLLKHHPQIQFSISIASSQRDELSYSSLMEAIHEGIDESRSVGGNKIVVK